MANILFLPHRLPYPPNKGDKSRSYHILRVLHRSHRVFVGTFIDDPEDHQYVETVRGMCSGLHVEDLNARSARIASLGGLLTGEALTLHYYRNAALKRWVEETVAREKIELTLVFSSSMAQYAIAHPTLPMLVDLVDVDSAKWTEYAGRHRWPMSWIYAREGRRLLACERDIVLKARRAFLATVKEVELFQRLAPESQGRVESLNSGVDPDFFAPDPQRRSPFSDDETALVFTGAMDYWPNVDAVVWFVQSVLPRLRERRPEIRFHIVGRSPTGAVRALAGEAVNVTGTVPDVRPYLQHAAVVVAPLRLARGIQNKILEAMAMTRPVVAAAACVDALEAVPGEEILPATEADDYVRCIEGLLDAAGRAAAIGAAGRRRVVAAYSWAAHLHGLELHIDRLVGAPPSTRPPELAGTPER